jgi:L-asparagine transporter-like permease
VTPTPSPVLPRAGSAVRWQAVGLVFIGAVFLILGLACWKK